MANSGNKGGSPVTCKIKVSSDDHGAVSVSVVTSNGQEMELKGAGEFTLSYSPEQFVNLNMNFGEFMNNLGAHRLALRGQA